MTEKRTPKNTLLLNCFFFKKETTPSTGSSVEGSVSQVKKSAKVQEDSYELKVDLMYEFDEVMSENETENGMEAEGVMCDFETHMEQCFSEFHEGIFAFTQWPFRCCQSSQICTACADIFLCLNSADRGTA
jgi:hypothetical protein